MTMTAEAPVTAQKPGHKIVLDLRGIPTASCECGQSYTDPDPRHFARWVARHVGVLAETPRAPHSGCGHLAMCYDGDGHTDGCLLEGLGS